MEKHLQSLSSVRVIIGLSLPLVLILAFVVFGLGLSPFVIVTMPIFKIYYAALVVALSIRSFLAFRARAYGAVLLAIGLVMLLLHGAYLYGYRFTANSSVGIDEGADKYSSVIAGPLARPSGLPIILKAATPGKSDTCKVLIAGKEMAIHKGQTIRWKDLDVTLTAIHEAPLFALSNAAGQEVEAAYFKLKLGPHSRDYFQFITVPYRFYVSLPGYQETHWKLNGKKWEKTVVTQGKEGKEASGDTLHLLVMRGKLTLLDKDVKRGKKISFEGSGVRFDWGAPWIGLKVEKVLNRRLLYAAFGFMLAGSIVLVWRRR